jgi:hypothetical protein
MKLIPLLMKVAVSHLLAEASPVQVTILVFREVPQDRQQELRDGIQAALGSVWTSVQVAEVPTILLVKVTSAAGRGRC